MSHSQPFDHMIGQVNLDTQKLNRLAVFYFVVPLLTGALFGFSGAGQFAPKMSYLLAMGYWAGLLQLKWLSMDFCTRVLQPVLKPWNPPAWLIIAAGAVTAALFFRPVYVMYLEWYVSWSIPNGLTTPAQTLGSFPWPKTSNEFLLLLGQSTVSIVLWVLFCLIGARFFGVPAYLVTNGRKAAEIRAREPVTVTPESTQPASDPVPAFLARRGLDPAARLIALKAEDHYLRTVTDQGEKLIHYRFSDAVSELGPDAGLRTHRSFWVAEDAISEVRYFKKKKRYELSLTNGQSVPVSRSYVVQLKDRGLLERCVTQA